MAATASPDSLDTLVLDEAGQRLLFTEARSANTFTDAPVTDDQLRAIYELSKFPPTAANINPLRILFIRPGEARERLVPLMSEGNRDKTASAPVVAVLASDLDFHERVPELFPARPELKDHFGADEEMRTGLAQYNGALQAGYFLLAVRAAGLAAGPMGGFDRTGVDAEFFPGSALRSHLVVNIGVPGEHAFERLPRLTYEDAVSHA